MTRKEAIIRLIDRKDVGYTPHHFDLTQKITHDLANHFKIGAEEVEDFIGNHFLYVDATAPHGQAEGYSAKKTNMGLNVDEFGVTWNNTGLYNIGDWAMVDHPIHDLSLDGYTFPDGKGEGRYIDALELIHQYPGRFNVLRMTGLLDSCWHLTGMQDFMEAMMIEEDFANTVMDHTTEYMINVINSAPPEIDAVRFIEDWGMQTGLLISKNLWKKYLEPRLKMIHAAVRKKGMYVMHHSCGNITALFPEIIDLGIDIIDAMQPETMDLAFLKKEYGKDIVFFGGLGAQSTLPYGSVDDVIREAEQTIDLLSRGGGYITGPAGSISTDTPLENVVALAEFCMRLKDRGV